jgi:hypothetical protein
MASRRLTTSLAYSRRVGSTRGATRVDYHSLVLIIGLLALAAFAGVLYLSQASVAAELRYGLAGAEEERQSLWEGNLALREAICSAERLDTVEAHATHLGMLDAPVTGPYVACVSPETDTATARRPSGSARVLEGQQSSSPWQSLLSSLRQRGAQQTAATAMDTVRR